EGAIVLVAFTNAIAFTRGASPSPRAIVSMSVHRKSDGERQDEMEDPNTSATRLARIACANHPMDRAECVIAQVSYSFQKLGLFLLELDYRLCTPFLMGPAVHPKLKSSCSLAVIGMAPQVTAEGGEAESTCRRVASRERTRKDAAFDLDKRYRGGKQEIGPSSLPARQKNYWIEVLENHGVTGLSGRKALHGAERRGKLFAPRASRELAPLGIGGIWRLGKLPLEAHLTPPEEKQERTCATGHRLSLEIRKTPAEGGPHAREARKERMVLPHVELKFQGKILRTRRQSRPAPLDIGGVWRLGKPPLNAHLTPEKIRQSDASRPEQEAVVARRPEQLQLLVWDAQRRYTINPTLTARRELDEARAKAFDSDSFQLFHESAVDDSWALDPQQLAEQRELRHKNLTDALARNRREPTPANLQALEEARRRLLAVSDRGDKAEGEDSDGYGDVDSSGWSDTSSEAGCSIPTVQDEIEASLKAASTRQGMCNQYKTEIQKYAVTKIRSTRIEDRNFKEGRSGRRLPGVGSLNARPVRGEGGRERASDRREGGEGRERERGGGRGGEQGRGEGGEGSEQRGGREGREEEEGARERGEGGRERESERGEGGEGRERARGARGARSEASERRANEGGRGGEGARGATLEWCTGRRWCAVRCVVDKKDKKEVDALGWAV
ncbi:hypothetical protein B0H14DRAFT_2622837, partial [Mycena olivaceomarginata]